MTGLGDGMGLESGVAQIFALGSFTKVRCKEEQIG